MTDTKTVRIGCVGLSGRGKGQMCEMLSVPGVAVPAVCDVFEDRAQGAAKRVEELTGARPAVYLDYREMLAKERLDAVLCCTTWITHGRIAVDAMRAGCDVAIEVGGAASLEECWQMVRASEETGKFCMLLENCCYDRKEMALFHMERQGIFGRSCTAREAIATTCAARSPTARRTATAGCGTSSAATGSSTPPTSWGPSPSSCGSTGGIGFSP